MTWVVRPGETFAIASEGGEQVISDDEGLTVFTPRKIPWDVVEQLRALRDARVKQPKEET